MEYQHILSMSTWLSLKPETKQKLRELFNIPRSGYVEVFDGKVFSDGTMLSELLNLTTEKMQVHLNSKETDFMVLFNIIIKQIEHPEEVEPIVVIGEGIISKPKSNGKTKKSK